MVDLGRDHHHHQSGVGQPLRSRLRRARVVRQQRQDRLGRGGHRQLGSDRGRHSRRHRSRPGRHRGACEGAKWCRVTSPAGTDVRVSIEGRPALEVTPIKKRGQMMGPVPLWAEVAFAAVEDRTEGTDRRRRHHARHRTAGSDTAPDRMEGREGQRGLDHRWRRGREAQAGHRGRARRRP